MAAPTLTLINHTEIDDADTSTGWSNITTADTDLKVEGTASMSGVVRNNGEVFYYDNGGAPATGVDKILRGWINTTNLPYMQPVASGGYGLYVYDGSSTSNYITLFGSDTYFGGWYYFVVDMNDFTGVTLANVDRWGIYPYHSASAKNIINTWMDVLRYLDGYSMTGGTSSDAVTLMDIEAADRGTTTLYGYGIVSQRNGVYFATGTVQFGTGATTHYFEMVGEVLVFVNYPIPAGLYSLSGVGSGTDIYINSSVIKSAGSSDDTRFAFDFTDSGLVAANVVITDNLIVRAADCDFKSGETITGNTFDDCGQITPAGADMLGSEVKNYEGASDSSALVWNETSDPDSYLEAMTFVKGTASTHAIEFGTSSPLTMTLTDMNFSGYNASDAATDSTFYVARTSGTVTINLVGCTGNFSYKSAGATVDIVSSASATFTPIENGSAFTITRNSDNLLLHDTASVTGGEVVYSFDTSLAGTAATVHIIIAGKEPQDFLWTLPATPQTVPISQVTDRIYSNP